jgi:hypothetical protein
VSTFQGCGRCAIARASGTASRPKTCLSDGTYRAALANRSARALGISNLFVPIGDDGGTRESCLGGAMDFAPGLPLAGYESGDDLARMKALGFAEIGPLRNWQAGN